MKKLLSFFTLIAVAVLAVMASSPSVTSIKEIKKTVIPLKGQYQEGINKLKTTPNPITVTWSDTYDLAVSSTKDIPTLTLAIVKEGDVMEEHTFTLDAGVGVTFNLDGYEPGEYSVVLTTPTGTNLTGSFVIE